MCKVFLGKDTIDIVCGANNVQTGMGVVVALPGTYIPSLGNKISIGKIRGVESHGMMCSELELNLSDEHDGIISLKNPKVGANFSEWLSSNDPDKIDPVIEIGITPNRPDALGVYGIARDLYAKGLGKLIPRKIDGILPKDKIICGLSCMPWAINTSLALTFHSLCLVDFSFFSERWSVHLSEIVI